MNELAPRLTWLKILKPVSYARQDFLPDAVVVVDAETAARWLRDWIASETESRLCPTCGSVVAAQVARADMTDAAGPR